MLGVIKQSNNINSSKVDAHIATWHTKPGIKGIITHVLKKYILHCNYIRFIPILKSREESLYGQAFVWSEGQ